MIVVNDLRYWEVHWFLKQNCRGTAASHFSGLHEVPVLGSWWPSWTGPMILGDRLAPSEAVYGTPQGAQPLPEPQLRFAGILWVVGHALMWSIAGLVQCCWFAKSNEDKTGGQEKEDADEYNDDRQRV